MNPAQPRPTAVIACRVLEEEVRHLGAGHGHLVGFDFLEMGLHENPGALRPLLQRAIGRAEANPEVEAVALAYGVCGMATVGLRADRCRLVLPRAHDCVTLLLGDRSRYAALMREDPARTWYSPGWNRGGRVPGPDREAALRTEYAGKFGAEEAEALLQIDRDSHGPGARAAYVDLGLPGNERDRLYAERCAAWLGWPCEAHRGDRALLADLLAGSWDPERFLVVPPGHAVAFSADESVVRAVPAPRET